MIKIYDGSTFRAVLMIMCLSFCLFGIIKLCVHLEHSKPHQSTTNPTEQDIIDDFIDYGYTTGGGGIGL